MRKITTEEFIRRSIIAHGNKYNYSKTVYVNCRTFVTVICPVHGEFKTDTYSHTVGALNMMGFIILNQ